jgi:hypothetical protein
VESVAGMSRSNPLAGSKVIMYGRIWVITEVLYWSGMRSTVVQLKTRIGAVRKFNESRWLRLPSIEQTYV